MSIVNPLVVMGGGPSLKLDHFPLVADFDTIGMNGAYRYYYKNNWWPKYFSCFDYAVTDNHREAWKKMIEDPEVPIERFFLLRNISQSSKLTVLPLNGGIGKFSTNFKTFGYGGNTGANSCQVGICLGYTKILLIGIDCDYKKEVVDGAAKIAGAHLKMERTPDQNPNYFMPDYQQKGDVYNFPQAEKFHRPAWQSLATFAASVGVEIINCGETSTLECFPRSTLEVEITKVKEERDNVGSDQNNPVS